MQFLIHFATTFVRMKEKNEALFKNYCKCLRKITVARESYFLNTQVKAGKSRKAL